MGAPNIGVAIVGATRSPFCGYDGPLSGQHPASLASYTLRNLLAGSGLRPDAVDAVIAGCASQSGGQGLNVARSAALGAGWPDTVSAVSVNSQQSSGVEAILLASGTIATGSHRFVAAGGVEHMSQVPLGLPLVDQHLGSAYGPDVADRYRMEDGLRSPGMQADHLAASFGVTRDLIEQYASASRRRALSAQKGGLFDDEVGPWPTEIPVSADQFREPPTDQDLQPWFSTNGVHTASTVAPPADGASFVLLASPASAHDAGLEPLASIVSTASVGCGTTSGAVAATRLVIERAGISIADIDVLEVDEAFASTPVIWSNIYGVDLDRCNQTGGALSFGNPLGAAGARMTVRALTQLQQTGGRYALIVTNGIHGVASALIIERQKSTGFGERY